MTDDFLHRIRVEPPADFLARLKSRLDKQLPPPQRARRGAWLRGLAMGLLFGGSVFAISLLTINGVPQPVRDLISSVGREHGVVDATRDSNRVAGRLASGGRSDAEIRQDLPVPSSPNHRGADNPSTANQGPMAEAVHKEKAPATATNTVSNVTAIATGTSGGYGWTVNVLALKSLQEYAALIAQRMRYGPNMKTSIKLVATSTEALATLCSKPDAKSDLPPDVAITTRRITPSENDTCARNIEQVREVPLGNQAIVILRSKVYGAPDLAPRDVFLALAAEVPDTAQPGAFVPNPYTNWSRINAALENEPIEVIGPPRSSMTAAALVELLLEPGCRTFPEIAALQQSDKARYEQICTKIRTDGIYSETDEGSYVVLPKLQLNPNAIAIGGYSLITWSQEGFVVGRIGGVTPNPQTIRAGTYLASRPLYAYVGVTSGSYFNYLVRFAETQGRGFLSMYSIVPPNQ